MKKIVSVLLLLFLCFSLCACGKSQNIIAAENAVKAVGNVTLDSASAIEQAEKAISALSDEEKKKFKSGAEFEEIKKQYNKLTEEEKVKLAVEKINLIGDVTLESATAIDEADKAYQSISEEFRAEVTNVNELNNAKSSLRKLRTEEKDRVIAEKTPMFNINYDKVQDITWYEHKSLPKYIDIRSYVIPFLGKSGNNYWISTRYNYTGDDWIFWNKMTILVDGTKYYKNVGRGNTVRDNDTEVWEYYEEPLESNVGMDNSELKMLKAIAQSDETVIRFEGDDYYYDLTVTPTDKKIISDVLALYEALIS